MRKTFDARAALFLAALAGHLGFQALAAESHSSLAAESLDSLQLRISNHLAQPRFAAAMWGVKVASLDTGKILFEHNAGKLFSPASNTKLYTTALAFDQLGADYRITTSVYATAKPDRRGVLHGDLMVYGRGDPTISARLHNDDICEALEPFVAVLTNAGIKRIQGNLIGDDSYFHGPPYGSGWVWDDTQSPYGAELSALSINDNILQLSVQPGANIGAPCKLALSPAARFGVLSNRTETAAPNVTRQLRLYRPPGSNVIYVSGQLPIDDAAFTDEITVHNPAALFVGLFKEALARHSIKVSGRTRTMNWLDREATRMDWNKWVELGAVASPPMRELIREILKPSQNLYADLLLAHVGASSKTSQADQTSEAAGIAALRVFLTKAGIAPSEVQFEEGAGLSRNNLTTPNATVALLQYMSRHKFADAYRDALPIAGVDGTLRDRMKGTPAAGNVRAKTGTLRWAHSLSGYVTTAAGEHLAFSIMLNRYPNADPDRSARDELDALAVMLAGFSGRSG